MNNIIIPPSIVFVSIQSRFFDHLHNHLDCNRLFLSNFLDYTPYTFDIYKQDIYYIDLYHNGNGIKDYFRYIAFNGYEVAGHYNDV